MADPVAVAQAQSNDATRFRYRDYQFVDDDPAPVIDPSKQLLVANAATGVVIVALSDAEAPPAVVGDRPQHKWIANVGAVFDVVVQTAAGTTTVAPGACAGFAYVPDAAGSGRWTALAGGGGGGSGSDGGTGAGAIDKLFWNPAAAGAAVFPVAGSGDTRAYYPVVLHDASAPFSPDAAAYYAWVATYAGSGATTLTFAFSNDGLAWTSPTKATGIVANGYHAELRRVGAELRMWYWDPSVLYTPAAMRTATCPLAQIPQFAGDVPCANGTPPWTGQPAPAWNRGTYGPSSLFYNAAPTNVPGRPETYRYHGFVDETTGGTEDLGLVTSDDGVTWSLADPNPIVPRTPAGWDATHLDAGSAWFIGGGEVQLLFSGGNGSLHDGIGFAYSASGSMAGPWTKHSANPVFRRVPATNWAARCYTPTVVRMRDALGRTQLRVYYTGDDGAGTRAVYAADEELHWFEKASTTPEADGQGLRLP